MRGAFFFDIDTITIRKDSEGRYCLNDIHASAGGEEKDKPMRFLRSDNAAALVDELNQTNSGLFTSPVKTVLGRTGGTYVCKELVYAYAMWAHMVIMCGKSVW